MAPKSYYFEGAESFLQTLFSYFSYFAFDKAKEQADRERDASRNLGSTAWVTLITSISQLATVEKLYMNLSFSPKGFLRKESSVKQTYETIVTELEEIQRRRFGQTTFNNCTSGFNSPGSNIATKKNVKICSEGVLLHICTHLVQFIKARLRMLSFYLKLITCSSQKYVNYDEMLRFIHEIIEENRGAFHHPVLAPIKTTFTYESEINSHLLGSLKGMQNWLFLSSLLHLHDGHNKLLSWQSIIQSKEAKKYTFGSSFLKPASLPALYQWLWNAKSSFVAKFSLYFYEVLSVQAPPSETRNFLSKLTCDYVGKIQTFQRKIDALSVCIILRTSELSSTEVPGYCYPSETLGEEHSPSDMVSYSAIFAFPVKPVDHWPYIVTQISEREADECFDKVITVPDQMFASTYFLCQIEPCFYIVIVFENKKPEKDNFIKDSLFDLAKQLRCNKVFADLKPS